MCEEICDRAFCFTVRDMCTREKPSPSSSSPHIHSLVFALKQQQQQGMGMGGMPGMGMGGMSNMQGMPDLGRICVHARTCMHTHTTPAHARTHICTHMSHLQIGVNLIYRQTHTKTNLKSDCERERERRTHSRAIYRCQHRDEYSRTQTHSYEYTHTNMCAHI